MQDPQKSLLVAQILAGQLPPASTEAFIANLSRENLTITALLPNDADEFRSLVFRTLDGDPGNGSLAMDGLERERTLRPGEVAQFALRKPPSGNHTSLFRLRKEGQAGSCFLKYTVGLDGDVLHSALIFVRSQAALPHLEQAFPQLILVR